MAIDDNTSYELTGAQIKDLTTKIKSKADSSSLATVATSGNYNDLNNLPTLPTVNNGALTIQQNGTTLDTFTANSPDNKTVNIQTITAETVAPAEEVGAITTNVIADGAVAASKIDLSTIVMKGTWTTTATGGIGTNAQSSAIDVSSFGFSSADDYVVTLVNRGGASNGWATNLMVSEKTATSFKITQWNCHWSSGTIGAGNIIDWAVFKVV